MIENGEITGGVVAFSDITERKQHEKELQQSLKEKETLLQEIHHRVKNNLAVVSGMMQMQVFEEEDENVKQKLSDGINRIQTMGNIHELLYQSESFSRVDADKNIRKLVTDVVNTFQIGIDLDIAFDLQKISLNINQAIPFSLIINEVTTNVMKHAFVDQKQGTLSVSLTEEDNVVSIHIVDNGQGLPDNFDRISNSNSLGLKLIKTLSTQLDGEYTYKSLDEDTLFTFSFEKADVKGVGNAHLN
jgi:two-component sensor histidine kinase